MKVSLLQLDIAFGQPEANYATAERVIRLAAAGKPDCLLLPELWTTGYDLTRLGEMADPEGKEALTFIGGLAKEYGINIVAGSTAWQRADGTTNTMFAVNREGQPVLEYSKLHLFRLMDEHLYLQPGASKGLFDLDGISSAGVICYDIRFPEWIRAHMTAGAEVLFAAAEWPLPRLAHWRALLVSRAIENQCYVVACNRAGSDPANVFAGHSMIIDPWGEILCEAGEGEEIITGELDLSKVREARRQIPVFADRRPELYT
ncbi:carbon-nitrogen family hydrolase [Paenibacillus sabinae]|uniref:Nitrilase/cyanide hydratase and apolipoprotein N-acyltransferase n=1 Tax=Paenibacillus sabinae T27 TaxID=1268072 RepID=X4ZF93_9BACL|nr:carbon-nitrogen family hydrolase [Paenibacillus sabinae]AHV95415.1 nitrilase/cyanide hydratase and apolipoprotein N-acyltransferase [Paenibacillus sabinae T27]